MESVPINDGGHLLEITYIAYLVISIALTMWVARTLQKRGRIFLVDVFKTEELADSVNHLLVVGFYLINIGYVCRALKEGIAPQNLGQCIEMLSQKVGAVLLILGAMHFFNMFVFSRVRKSKARISQMAYPIPPIPQAPVGQ
jgi:hypothetical protein